MYKSKKIVDGKLDTIAKEVVKNAVTASKENDVEKLENYLHILDLVFELIGYFPAEKE